MKNGVLLQLAPALLFRKQVSFVCARCMLGVYLLLLLGSVQMRPHWEMKRSLPGHQKRSKMKAVSWCEKRLRTPQLVVLGICVLLLLPVVLFIAFFLPSIPLIASSSSSPWNKCYCLQPSNCAWPQYKLLFTTIGYISLCCVMCVCVVM